MRRLVIFSLILCISHLCYCDRSTCGKPWTIFLLTNNEKLHKLTYIAFEKLIRNQDIVIKRINVDGMPLLNALEKANNRTELYLRRKNSMYLGVNHDDFVDDSGSGFGSDGDYINNDRTSLLNEHVGVIYLNAEDFYNNNYNDILNYGYQFAGDERKKKNHCRSGLIHNAPAYIQNMTFERCTIAPQNSMKKHSNVKLLSNSIIDNFPELHELVSNFPDTCKDSMKKISCILPTVVVSICDVDKRGNFKSHSFTINESHEPVNVEIEFRCNNFNEHKTIAVWAPKPFESETLDITTIFYDHVYTVPEDETKDVFRNSFPLMTSPKKLKYAFLKFLQMIQWSGRVAIISDDSTFSQEFEQELTALLDEETIVHASKSCVGVNCDFSGVFEHFKSVGVRLVIVNVGEENADKFADAVASENMEDVMWLVRAWSPQVASQAARQMGDVYSFKLAPIFSYNGFMYCEYEPHLCYLIYTIKSLEQLIKVDYLGDKNYQRTYTETIKRWFHYNTRLSAHVMRNGDEMIADIHFTKDDSVQGHIHTRPSIRQELTSCTFTTAYFFKPCNDMEYIILMLVIGIFAVTLLGIVYFFYRKGISYSRMSC